MRVFFCRRNGRNLAAGSSLLLVLCAIMLMSFALIGLISHLSRGLDESIHAEKEFRARLLLQSAQTLAMHPDIPWGDPLLRQNVSSAMSYAVDLSTEGVRLAINQLATSAVHRQFAQRLFQKWGLDASQAETLVDSIADWLDADDRPRPHGAEREYYTPLGNPHFPFNRSFDDIDDLLLVRGAEELEFARWDWRESFTFFGDGTVDLHRAPAEMLEALFDVTSAEVNRFVRARIGPDGSPDTEDDREFSSLSEVRSMLDVPPSNYNAVSAILTLHHPIRRAECFAWAGELQRRLTIISGPGLYLIREE